MPSCFQCFTLCARLVPGWIMCQRGLSSKVITRPEHIIMSCSTLQCCHPAHNFTRWDKAFTRYLKQMTTQCPACCPHHNAYTTTSRLQTFNHTQDFTMHAASLHNPIPQLPAAAQLSVDESPFHGASMHSATNRDRAIAFSIGTPCIEPASYFSVVRKMQQQ